MEKKLLSPKEVKEMYFPDIGINTVRAMMKREGFPVIRNGSRLYAIAGKIDAWLDSAQDLDLQDDWRA